MQIKSYKDGKDIEERYIPQLAERQAECWGGSPFNEYKICMNPECKAIFGIEEILGEVTKIRDPRLKALPFECTECSHETEKIYEKQHIIQAIQEYLLGEVSALLILDEQDAIEGFGVISKTTIRGLMGLEFDTRVGSYETEETIKNLGKILYGSEDAENRDVICFHQIYLSPLIRNSKLSYQALKALFEINREDYKGIPTVGETRYDCKFYPISRSIGFQNLEHDKHGYVIQHIQDYSYVLDFLDSHSGYQDFLGDMIKFKKESRKILREDQELGGKIFYR